MLLKGNLLSKLKAITHIIRKTPCELCGRRFSTSIDQSKCRLIQEITGCTEEAVRNSVLKKLKLQLLSENDIRARIDNLEECGIEDYRINNNIMLLLSDHPFTIRNRVMYLREAGFQQSAINVANLKHFLLLTKNLVCQLKMKEMIPHDTNVMENLLKHIELDKEFYPDPLPDEQYSLSDVRVSVLTAWLKYTVKVDENVLNKINVPDSYSRRMTTKSLRCLQENYNIAKNILGMSEHKIARNSFVLHVNPENSKRLISEIKSVGGRSFTEILKSNPKILNCTVDNVKNVINKIEINGLSGKTFRYCPSLLTYNHKTIDKKIHEMKNHEYMSACFYNPRAGKLLNSQKKVEIRAKILEDAHINYACVDSMVEKSKFIEYIKKSCINNGTDTLWMLTNRLGVSNREIKMKLALNRFWMYVPITSVKKTLEYLITEFTQEEIIENMTILLYSSERLEKEIKSLEFKEGLEMCKKNGKFVEKLKLPLLLYFLEKEANFTDESIWFGSEYEKSSALDLPVSYQTLLELADAN